MNDEQLLNTVARRLREKLKDETAIYWPPHVEELEQDERPNDLLRKLLTWLKNPSDNDFNENCQDPEVMALSLLLFSFITGKHAPLKINVSMTIHGLTRNREIIDLLKRFSLGISYQDVLNLYATWTKYELEKNNGCPADLLENVPGVAVMDNDDFQYDTLTGAETSHRTNVMFVQPEDIVVENVGKEDRTKLTLAKPMEIKELAAEQHKIYKTAK